MKNIHSQKLALIGLPGSGKSTFASKLGKILDIPVHHLDRHMVESGGDVTFLCCHLRSYQNDQ